MWRGFYKEMLWLLIPQYLISAFSWNSIMKWGRGNILNVKFTVKVNILFDSQCLWRARSSQHQLHTQLQSKADQQKSACAETLMQPIQGSFGFSACTAMSCAVSPLQCSAGIYLQNFSQVSILTLNYYHFSPAQTGEKSFTQHTHFCSEKFLICILDSMKGENN